MDASERRCIEAAAGGDEQAFQQLLRQHHGVVRGLMRRMTGDAAAADDLAQDTFLIAWQKLGDFRGGSFRSWLCTIACRLYFRQQRRDGNSELSDDLDPVDAMAAEPGCRIDLDRAIGALPGPQRLALLLSALAEMSHADIAKATGWPLGTVKSHVARGKATLRHKLEGYADDDFERHA